MEIRIDTESDEFRKVIEESVVNSGFVQDKVEQILETSEIEKILTEKVKNMLESDKASEAIKESVNNYIINSFDITDYDGIMNIVEKSVKNHIKSKLEKGGT